MTQESYGHGHERYLIGNLGAYHKSLDAQLASAIELIEQMDELAADRQFWVIDRLLIDLNNVVEKAELAPELVFLLAKNLPLSSLAIFGLLGNGITEELSTCLVDNLFRFRTYTVDSACLDEHLAELMSYDNSEIIDKSVVYILEKLIETAEWWDFWDDPMNKALTACFDHNRDCPAIKWFLENEQRLLDLDFNHRLIEDRSFSIGLNMHERGMKNFALETLDKNIRYASGFEYLEYEKIVGPVKVIENAKRMNEYARYCYAISTEHDPTPLLDLMPSLSHLTSVLDSAFRACIPLDNRRVSYMARESVNQRTYSLKDFRTLEETLKKFGFTFVADDLDLSFQALAYSQRKNPNSFSEVCIAAADLNIQINRELAQHIPEPSSRAGQFSWNNVALMLNADLRGSPMPRDIIAAIVRNEYEGWDENSKRAACALAPSWLLTQVDVIATEKLEADLGL
jgi:hypothetical protein